MYVAITKSLLSNTNLKDSMARVNAAQRLMRQTQREMTNNTGLYPRLTMSQDEAEDADNRGVFVASMRRQPNDGEEVIKEFKYLQFKYYTLDNAVDFTTEQIMATERFKLDVKCGLEVPTYGELQWHYWKEATPVWTVDLASRYHTQYRLRLQCHAYEGYQAAFSTLMSSVTSLTMALMTQD